MLARLSLLLDGSIGFRQSSLLQGYLMELLDVEYAEYLHQKKLHPYSQYVKTGDDGGATWVIQTLSQEAYENIIAKLEDDEIILHHRGELRLKVLGRHLEKVSAKDLVQDFYNTTSNRRFELEFLTPTAFRQNKRYVILPDIRLIVQNLMLKFSAAQREMEMTDEDALEQIAGDTIITRHNIRSLPFPAEGQNIPGFLGRVACECRGSETMTRYLRLLLSFGEFSGVGIKTAMGMGAVRIL